MLIHFRFLVLAILRASARALIVVELAELNGRQLVFVRYITGIGESTPFEDTKRSEF